VDRARQAFTIPVLNWLAAIVVAAPLILAIGQLAAGMFGSALRSHLAAGRKTLARHHSRHHHDRLGLTGLPHRAPRGA
jgi:hypothetical protein